MSLLMCDKQHSYLVLLILPNSEHKLSESVRFRGKYPSTITYKMMYDTGM